MLKLIQAEIFLRKLYYAAVHGIYCGTWYGSMLPKLGAGKFVDVLRKGDLIDIHDRCSNETIRLVPYQPNHGVMVEWFTSDGSLRTRHHLSFDKLKQFAAEFSLETSKGRRC